MHVVEIESDILSPNGRSYKVQIGRLTLLTGPNGSGKTTLAHALRLPLAGTTDDIANRDGVKDPQLLRELLSPLTPRDEDGGRSLFSSLTFDDGSTARWGLYLGVDGTVKRPRHEPHPGVDPERVLALRSIWSVLRGDEKAARRALLAWIGQGVQEEDALALIPAHLHAKWKDIASKQPGSVVDKVVAVAEYAARRAREIEAEAAAQDRLVDQLGSALGTTPAPSEIGATRTALGQWRELLTLADGWEDPGQLQQEQQRISADLTAANAALDSWTAELGAIGETAEQTKHKIAHTLLDEAECASGTCPACGATPGADVLRSWSAWHASKAEQLNSVDRARSAREAAEGWNAEVGRLERALGIVEGRLQALQGKTPPPVSAAECRSAIQQYEQLLTTQERAAGSWETVKNARDAAAELRASKPAYQDLATACNEAVAGLLERLSSAFSARVQTYLPDRYQFGMRLKDTFEIGFVRDGAIHTLLSGTELDAMQVALAMAVADMGTGTPAKKGRGRPKKAVSSPYALIIPQDRDRDRATLGELMRAWSKFSGQVILESTEPPLGRLPKEWTLVEVARAAAVVEPAPEPDPEPAVTVNPNPSRVVVVIPGPDPVTVTNRYTARLHELGFTEEQARTLTTSAVGAAQAILAGSVPPSRVLFSAVQVLVFDEKGRPQAYPRLQG